MNKSCERKKTGEPKNQLTGVWGRGRRQAHAHSHASLYVASVCCILWLFCRTVHELLGDYSAFLRGREDVLSAGTTTVCRVSQWHRLPFVHPEPLTVPLLSTTHGSVLSVDLLAQFQLLEACPQCRASVTASYVELPSHLSHLLDIYVPFFGFSYLSR